MELKLILGFLFHFIGDYLIQNDWMAKNKTSKWLPALTHALLYSLLFMLIASYAAWFIIFITHLLIDRFRLAVYWIKLVNWNWSSNNMGYSDNTPPFMSIWLMIIIDNIWHILINSLCLYLLC